MRYLYLLLVAVFLFLYIVPLSVRPLLVPDETRYAEISREMIQSEDYVVPHLNGLRYFEKPVLGYWLNAASLKLFGENEFAVRFASAAATGLSALLLLLLARRFAGGDFVGISAAMIFLTCFEVLGVGVFSVLDSMLAFFITAGMVCYFYAYSTLNIAWQKVVFFVLCGFFWGCAFLTKGFVALAIPVAAIVPFLIWEKNWKSVFSTPWIPLIAFILTVLPWALLIWKREPDFWHYFFWEEHIKRFAGAKAQHKQSFLYFFMFFPLAALPWTFLVPAAWPGIKKYIEKPVIKFAICWFIFPFLFFSLSKGKLLTYILPCFVPFALLIAFGLGSRKDLKIDSDFKIGALLAVFLFSLLTVGLLIIRITNFHHFKPYAFDGQYWLLIASLLAWVLILGMA
ncbi:MAG: phospholipid carrier-dependent glycosyltransferase, partial [Desulfobacteraceae bacterium]|nr:phospholipid carrier-dependent glycosyltransferase [Desulfobacteraceae bacterium]